MGEIQQIVDQLNQPPFTLGLSLVGFSRKSPEELRQVLNDVLSKVDSKQARDLRDEPPDVTTARMVDFLRILKYRPSVDGITFRQGMATGASDVIYPVLAWVLKQIPMLQKRAYLAQFLVDVDIPEELFMDGEIQDLSSLVKDLQEQFKEIHKSVDLLRKTKRDPEALKKQVADYEAEKEQLNVKISRTQTKLQGVSNVEAVLEVAGQLRRQQEEEVQLIESSKEQQAALESATQRQAKAAAKLRDIRASASTGAGAGALLQMLVEETSLARYNVQEKLPKEVQKRRQRLQILQRIVEEPVSSEQDLAMLQAEVMRITTEVNALLEQRVRKSAAAVVGGTDALLRQQQQMAAMVGKKKEAAFSRLEALSDRKLALAQELTEKQTAVEEIKGKVLKGEDFKRYAASLRGKNATYKKMKRELEELSAEYGVLLRTQQILQGQVADMKDSIAEAERRKGISGFQQTQETLESVSAAKSQIDEEKGQTLEAISQYVVEINTTIKDRKTALAPQVKELRQARTDFQELEQTHAERKKKYDEAMMVLESQQGKLESEVARCQEDCAAEETEFKKLTAEAETLEVNLKKVTEDGPGLAEKYHKDIEAREEMAKTLRERQRKIKDGEKPSIEQMLMAKDLKLLLEAKLALYRGESIQGFARPAGFQAVELKDTGGANRLVISGGP